ncbi:MAG: hypothetical protein A2W23_04460 [Planctomycetes bacterium RBG_16_43_13]|nr:MAG: hypothetical protein A2W23_04460 [Planctomycetes bacterium RBG_16_43_13]
MAIGRSFRDLRGVISLGDKVVATQWKGMLVTRSMPSEIRQSPTAEQAKIHRIIAEVSPRWRFLSAVRRAEWEAYAKMLGSAYEQEKRMTTGRIGIISWKRGVLMSGQSAYLRCNILAGTSNLAYPRDKAPLPSGPPPSPCFKYARYEILPNGDVAIVGELENGNLFNHYERKWRLWVEVIYLSANSGPHIAKIFDIPTSDGKFALTTFRARESRWGKFDVNFNELHGGFVLLQAETVIADSPEHGPLRSAGSEVIELTLPPQPDTPAVVALRENIRSILRNKEQRSIRRRKALGAFLDTIADKMGIK